jgi:hypothetical protein
MIRLLPLLFLAIFANAGTLLLINYSNGVPGEEVSFWDTLLNVEWIACMVVALLISLVSRKQLFSKKMLFWSVLLLIFCTPAPLIIKYKLQENYDGAINK